MPFFYTPFPGILHTAIMHGGGQCASLNDGTRLGQKLVAHCNAASDKIYDDLGHYLTAEELIAQMLKYGWV